MSDSNFLENGIAEIKVEREGLLLESLSPADLQAEIWARGWKEIVLNQRLLLQGEPQSDDSKRNNFKNLCTALTLNRSIIKMKIEYLDAELSSSLFLSVGYIPTLRVLEVTCRAAPSEIATLSLLLKRARFLEKVEIHLLLDHDTRTFALHEIPDALRNHPNLCELKILVSICAASYSGVSLDLGSFFRQCAELSSLDYFHFGNENHRWRLQGLASVKMCNKVMHCLLGSGISNISLSDVELVDSQESVDYQLFMCGNYRELHRI
eukprot:scaffold2576_cov175-Amphora_coffeaeformis.AAC.21